MRFHLPLLLLLLTLNIHSLQAQDDLLDQLRKENTGGAHERVLATFKGNHVVNMQSTETVRKHNLDFRVSHLFGAIGEESGGGKHTLYGIDQSNDIRIGLHYGITDRWMVGIARYKRLENVEGFIKYRLLEQTRDNHVPVALTAFSNIALSTVAGELVERDLDRLSYHSSLLLARKFTPDFSLAVGAGYLHRNATVAGDPADVFSLQAGFRWRFTKSASLLADYSHAFGRDDLPLDYRDVLGAGLEIETGGHVFTVLLSNASGLLENDFLVNTLDSWSNGGMKFSFIISRVFGLGK
jgi:hypothetical protein